MMHFFEAFFLYEPDGGMNRYNKVGDMMLYLKTTIHRKEIQDLLSH
jgi:hypothetical protein